MASTEAEETSQSINNKTSVLRVSIHCKGCQRKVHKLLQSVPGVHDIQIEAKEQRVVVTGDVSPEALVRKLVKAGKHADLWPEKPPEIPNRKAEKSPSNSQGSVSEESAVSAKEIKPPTTRTENPVEDPKRTGKTAAPDGGEPESSGGKGDEGVGKSEAGKESVEIKAEEKKPETGSAGNQASESVEEKKEEQPEKNGGGDGGGEGKKKKKKKSQNSNKSGSSSASPPVTGRSVNDGGGGGGGPPPTRPPTNQSPPRHYGYQYPPPHYYTPPPAPVYTVSYNTAQPPVNSYTASYYAPPPPQSYAYSHFGSEMAPPPHVPSDYDSYRQQPSDSFEMFSDENPNGCLVM